MRPIVELNNRVSALERRIAGMMRHGKVAEVDTAAGWVRLDIGPGADGPLLSPKVPYAQIAGGLKVHTPPSVGQQMTLMSPTGDSRQAVAIPMTWSDQNTSPGDGVDPVLTYGAVRIDLAPDGVTIAVGGVSVEISGDGVRINGGKVTHDGKNIGSDHKHSGVEPGPGLSNVPV